MKDIETRGSERHTETSGVKDIETRGMKDTETSGVKDIERQVE